MSLLLYLAALISSQGHASRLSGVHVHLAVSTCCNIYLDFIKAFDNVSCNILITKLRKCGLKERTVRQVENWLDGRAQRVVISGVSLLGSCS